MPEAEPEAVTVTATAVLWAIFRASDEVVNVPELTAAQRRASDPSG